MKHAVQIPGCCALMSVLFLSPCQALELDNRSLLTQLTSPSELFSQWFSTGKTIPECETYQKIQSLLSDYSDKVEFLPAATDYYFDASASYYDYLALPIAAVPSDQAKIELFGQLYDPHYYSLSNLDKSHWLHNFKPMGEMDWGKAKLAFGLGTTLRISEKVKLRSFYTTGTIPGLGDSKLAFSAQFEF